MGDDFAFDAGGRKPGCDGSDADRRRGSANGRWRHTIAVATAAASSSAAAHGAGSRSTAK
jgi:hypothetical protein